MNEKISFSRQISLLFYKKKSLGGDRENIRSFFQSGRSEPMKLDVNSCWVLNESGPFQEDGHLPENIWPKNNEVSSFLVVMILAA